MADLKQGYRTILGRILNAYALVGQVAAELIFENRNIEAHKKNEINFHEKRKRFNAFE